MSQATTIEWTDATWNPIRGCAHVSEGCRHCYAETVANRFCGPGKPYEGVVQIGADGKGTGKWNGQIKFVEKRLLDPLRWKKPQRIFVNSMSDLFHENVTGEMRDRIFAVMALCPQHTFQVLTKRPARMLAYLSDAAVWARIVTAMERIALACGWAGVRVMPELAHALVTGMPLPHVWLGVSVENQKTADERIPLLLQTSASVRFVSVEPLLGPVNLDHIRAKEDPEWYSTCLTAQDIWWTDDGEISDGPEHGAIDWVIVGGESGPGARPMHPDWARSLRDQCVAAGVPFFFKQWGEWAPGARGADYPLKGAAFTRIDVGGLPSNDPTKWLATDALFYRVGKKAAGHLLDGKEWRQFLEVRA